MARVVTGNFAIDIGNSANTTAYGDFVVTGATSSIITLNYPAAGVVEHYYGNFLYDGSGGLAGGTLQAYDQYYAGQVVVQAWDVDLPATQVANAMLTRNTAALLNLALGGSDQIWGSVYDDAISGGGGSDTIIALDGFDSVNGGAGNDDVNGNVGRDVVHGDDGDDTVRGGKDNDTVFGDAGNDAHVNGNIGNDSVSGGTGDDTCYGGQDQDTLSGGTGNDLLSGDLGNDVLNGDAGNDLLYGGAGADTFVFRANQGIDLIADFSSAAGDRIQLATGTTYTIDNSLGYAVIVLNSSSMIGVYGVSQAQLGDWLVFG